MEIVMVKHALKKAQELWNENPEAKVYTNRK